MSRTKADTFANAAPNTLFLSTAALGDDLETTIRLSDSPNIDDTPMGAATLADQDSWGGKQNPHRVVGRVLWHHARWNRGLFLRSCRAVDQDGSYALAEAMWALRRPDGEPK